jgi:hypothetical protein
LGADHRDIGHAAVPTLKKSARLLRQTGAYNRNKTGCKVNGAAVCGLLSP